MNKKKDTLRTKPTNKRNDRLRKKSLSMNWARLSTKKSSNSFNPMNAKNGLKFFQKCVFACNKISWNSFYSFWAIKEKITSIVKLKNCDGWTSVPCLLSQTYLSACRITIIKVLNPIKWKKLKSFPCIKINWLNSMKHRSMSLTWDLEDYSDGFNWP